MRRGVGLVGLVALAAAAWGAAPPAKSRALTAGEEKEVAALDARLNRHYKAGEFEQVAKLAEQIATYRRERQGTRHHEAIDARFEIELWRRLAGVPTKDRAEVLRAMKLNSEGVGLRRRGRSREAETPLRQALQIYEKILGKEHPHTAASTNNLARCLQAQGKPAQARPLYRRALQINEKVLGKEHPYTATNYNGLASCLKAQGKSAEALPLFRQALQIREKVLGKEHPDTAGSYNNVATCLQDQRKSSEALPLYRQALRIEEKVLGTENPRTAQSYNNLAYCLNALGKPAEALPLYRRALRIREKALPSDHPHTVESYNNVAFCLQVLGKPAEALPLFHQALQINVKVQGKEHPDTADSYNNLASCLNRQGKSAEALSLYRQALQIREKVLPKDHPDTAASFNNVAFCLQDQRKHDEALPLFRQALSIKEKVRGKDHPDTAASYNNVAFCLHAQGKLAEALLLYRRALRVFEKELGKQHPSTATSTNNLAGCLQAQGKHDEALHLYRQALLIRGKALGDQHPDTATSINNLALCLWQLERRNESVRLWQSSLPGQEAARVLRADSGFDRALFTRGIPPRTALAVGLARLKQPGNAFRHAEASLARALLDDLSGLTRSEAQRAEELRAALAALEPALASLSSAPSLSDEQKERHERLKQDYARLWRDWSDLLTSASARAVLPLERIQKSIPPDAALVLWIEALGELWACVVRSQGTPTWQKLQASDANQPARLHACLIDPTSAAAERDKLLTAFGKERFDPLRPHLKGVKRLFVVPTGVLARIPADLIADDFAISYVPSGSLLARTVEKHRAIDGSSLLALGDPIFDKASPAAPPPSGLFVKSVLPGRNASKAGLQAGDVLLSVGSTTLQSFDDLQGALSALPAKATVWRDGKQLPVRLPGSPLGAVFDKRSARDAVDAWRKDRELLVQRGTGHKRLPGTRLEVEAIAALVKGSTSLLGSDAREQKLDELIDSGKLKGYRLVHLATHGEADDQRPGRSALILAQDKLPDPLAQVNAGKHPYDGRLTVTRIRERWELDADLVVLSACETGLGRDAGGDGLLGFAQAFLSKGARSLLLSRWKVDDTATALLMIRFYENLLDSRDGPNKPLGRAAALDEAKKWLRALPRKQAERLATLYSGGELRGSEGVEKVPGKTKPVVLKGDRPYAHPFYWAAFTLVGDPD